MKLHDVSTDPMDRGRFPVDPWRLVETSHSPADLGVSETLFTVGNGYLGMRGNPEEGRDAFVHGTFINGFHESWPIRHAESAFGFARVGQTIVNVPDAKVMKIYVDDEPLILGTADLEHYERVLDFRVGVLSRELVWRTPAGKRVRVRSTRMVSFTQRHLALMSIELTMLSGDAPVVISSQILNRQDGEDEYHVTSAAMGEGVDPRKASTFADRVLLPRSNWSDGNRMLLGYQCAQSRMTLAVAADHTILTDNAYERAASTDHDLGKVVYRVEANEGQPVTVEKTVTYHSSRGVPVRELTDRCTRTLDRVTASGVEHYYTEQRRWLDNYWANADVTLAGEASVQQAIRYNLFQLAQATARADQQGVPAKGVTGSGYEGHYFWDTEVYVTPFLTYTLPHLARNTLHFRTRMLPAARTRAKDLAQRGALFPWRTISGEEASAYYAAGTAQYHIDADIAFALSKYVDATGDEGFLSRDGIDILVETARMWADLGFWRSNGDRSFHIHGVTGPDEYTTVVNNNLFTNVMARFNLERAARGVRELRKSSEAAYNQMVHRLGLSEAEVAEWEECAAGMTIPFDEILGIHPQDEHFLDREVWDLSRTPTTLRPLLLHYHPLVIYRFQVLKQADVVLALFLQGDRFTREEKKANFEYYDPITTGDSTLSAVVQSVIAAEVGYHDMAVQYFLRGLYVDLIDLHRNTVDGLHIASAGGIWAALVHGFGGMRDHDGHLSFDPRLPPEWTELTFRVRWRGSRLRVNLTTDMISLVVEDPGKEPIVHVSVRGEPFTVDASGETRVPLSDQGPRIDGRLGETPLVGGVRADGTKITAGVPDPSRPAIALPVGADPLS